MDQFFLGAGQDLASTVLRTIRTAAFAKPATGMDRNNVKPMTMATFKNVLLEILLYQYFHFERS